MNRIVRESYPVAELPEDLRAELSDVERVRVVLEPVSKPAMSAGGSEEKLTISDGSDAGSSAPTLNDLWAMRRPPFKSVEQVADEVRVDRDAWDD
jgi:hypothetical protein